MSAQPHDVEEIVFDAYTEEQAGTSIGTSLHEATAAYVDDLTEKQKELIEAKLEEYRLRAEEREYERLEDRTQRILRQDRGSFIGTQLLQAVIEA